MFLHLIPKSYPPNYIQLIRGLVKFLIINLQFQKITIQLYYFVLDIKKIKKIIDILFTRVVEDTITHMENFIGKIRCIWIVGDHYNANTLVLI